MKKTKLVQCVQNNNKASTLMVTIPLEWRKLHNLKKGSYLKFTYDDESIIITKIEVD